ncbi:Jag N-terminal domain-containing protein [Sulfurovum sp.]|uniref:Jag N-terminal domain-containing protein n=1 Tax=Sulfurovum sp. TaxID=1969726 RepID=UPI0025D6F0C5|nr:Jag N-terminal domain-containing protein [Sulfurovum sp.]
MTKVEAPTLEEAYQKASEVLECSISELQCEVVQHPSKGIFGFLKKNAVIVATCKSSSSPKGVEAVSDEVNVASEIMAAVKNETPKEAVETKTTIEPVTTKDAVVDSFFDIDRVTEDEIPQNELFEEESIVYDELALLIEDQLKELLSHSCFDIDIVEVDVRDNTALIFIDGADAALLIGKEGYRYNALSYLLFNWLHTKYELFIKLEIAEFLTSQQEMIRHYIKPVIENVEKYGKGKTRSLDGILVQIALEQLREAFPNKYVAVKTGREGNKFVVINEFNNKHE